MSKAMLMYTMMLGMMMSERHNYTAEPKEPRIWHEWDNISIPKAQRKGKSYEELQEMRKKIWEGKE
jgi:hypothetical protein